MDNGSQVEMTIKRMPEGGYLVLSEAGRNGDFRDRFVFASTSIDEALTFLRQKVAPVPPTQGSGMGLKDYAKSLSTAPGHSG
jgi:hypothetical protein